MILNSISGGKYITNFSYAEISTLFFRKIEPILWLWIIKRVIFVLFLSKMRCG